LIVPAFVSASLERDAGARSGNSVQIAVRQYNLAAALERHAMLDELQVGFIAGRVQRVEESTSNDRAKSQDGTRRET
jgi:hypothetical protein